MIARISQLDFVRRQVVEGFLSGMHKSPVYGQSVDSSSTGNLPGDDLRRIDWKVWQRSDKFVIKQYEAETNLRSYVVVDSSESMLYGIERTRSHNHVQVRLCSNCCGVLVVPDDEAAGFVWSDHIR